MVHQNEVNLRNVTHPDAFLILRTEEDHVGVGSSLQVLEVAAHHLLEMLDLVSVSQVIPDLQSGNVNSCPAGHCYCYLELWKE